MKRWTPEPGDIVRYRRKYVERKLAPPTLWEVLSDPDPQRRVLLGPAPERKTKWFGRRHLRPPRGKGHRTEHQGKLALVESAAERVALVLMGDE